MNVNKIYDITFDSDETIMTATLSKSNEVVMLMSSGNVIRFNLDDQMGDFLFSVKDDFANPPDGGFDTTAKTSIYTMDEIVVVVNDFKCHGFVYSPNQHSALRLWRQDYYAEISTYPIALYKNADSVPHLIFGVAWNHIQIMNLDTRQILTASKSLIEENAEEKHIEFYKNSPESNILAWPRPYDYFFGELFVSPNRKKFLSAGWAWGSCDSYNVYDIENFINSNRISEFMIGSWEHENRATCWIDDDTIAVAYNPVTEGDETSTADSPCEIHFHRINGNHIETDKIIQIAGQNIVSSKIYFNKKRNLLFSISEKDGLSVISLDGRIVYKDENLKSNEIEYNNQIDLFIKAEGKTISVFEITEQ